KIVTIDSIHALKNSQLWLLGICHPDQIVFGLDNSPLKRKQHPCDNARQNMLAEWLFLIVETLFWSGIVYSFRVGICCILLRSFVAILIKVVPILNAVRG
ncbi:MAG: hypothetical protein AABY09_04210, partial [Nanoarchaeota archaeon]